MFETVHLKAVVTDCQDSVLVQHEGKDLDLQKICIADETDTIQASLYGEFIGTLKVGESYEFTHAY